MSAVEAMSAGRPGEWMLEGICAQTEPDMWFDPPRSLQAALLCQGCPVLAQCSEYAVGFPNAHGVIAGKTASERVRARARERRGVSGLTG